jgi:hypothetical protein
MEESEKQSEEFIPKGAVAFFIVMIILFTIMWFSIYFEVLGRG